MKRIGGNTKAVIQTKGHNELNEIGERVTTWKDLITLVGFLDYMSHNTNVTNISAKIQESTHVFISDYRKIKKVTPENSRMIIDDDVYEIELVDDPMNLHQHLEIYLKYIGGQ